MNNTKIVCTIGPASSSIIKLRRLMKNGMNLARLNFSHGTQKDHYKLLKNVQSAAAKEKKVVAIIQDLQGPRIRVGDLGPSGLVLRAGEKVILTTETEIFDGHKIPVTYRNMHRDVEKGERILLVDGLIGLTIEKVLQKNIHCRVDIGGLLETHKGINLPDTKLSLNSLSEKDRLDVEFGVKNKVDFVAMSFVRSANDVQELRQVIEQYEKKINTKNPSSIKIIVKIERREAIENIDEIIEACDAVMVARGDLGIELPAEDVPLMQKMIINKCLEKFKPVIVATQMLDSMIKNPRPTRAEVSDVANAVIDHADALMLSGETANGKYPAEAVLMMKKIIEKTEASSYDDLIIKITEPTLIEENNKAFSQMASFLANNVEAQAILAISFNGYLARMVSRYRPAVPIIVTCDDKRISRQLILSWGVTPIVLPRGNDLENLIMRALRYLKKEKIVHSGDEIIVISGESHENNEAINLLEMREVKQK